jgi:hypothetical protein
MNRLCIIILFMAALLTSACTDVIVPDSPAAEMLTIEASVEGFRSTASTRTADINYNTQFVSGDEMGIIALCDGKVMSEVENIKATFDGSEWTAEKAIANITGATYMAYVPYESTLNTEAISTPDDLTECLASSVDDTGQATIAEYRSQDILVCKSGTVVGDKLSFNFSHAFGMVELVLPSKIYHLTSSDGSAAVGDYLIPSSKHLEFTGKNRLCQVSTNCFRSIVRPDRAIEIKGTFEVGSKKRTYTYELSSNTIQPGECRRIIVDGCIEEDFAYEQGDFFLNDGSLIHRQDGLTADQQEKCIGVVYYMDGDNSRFGTDEQSALGTPHGYVLSLKDASNKIGWGPSKNLPNVADYSTIEGFQSDVNGLHNTQEIIADDSSNDYSSAAIRQYNNNVPTPSFCTDWFMPAMGQWFDLLRKLGDANFEGAEYSKSWGDNTYLTTISKVIHENINNKLAATGCDYNQIYCSYTLYWSSTEYPGSHACTINFRSFNNYNNFTTTFEFAYGNKGDQRNLRCIFAF